MRIRGTLGRHKAEDAALWFCIGILVTCLLLWLSGTWHPRSTPWWEWLFLLLFFGIGLWAEVRRHSTRNDSPNAGRAMASETQPLSEPSSPASSPASSSPASSPPPRVIFGTWKRALVFGLAFGAGFLLALVLIGVAVWARQNRTTTVHSWNSIQLPQIGIKASLKTQARDGSVRYQFSVSPLSAELEDAFDRVAKPIDETKAFSAIFYDSNGFERCRGELNPLTPVTDATGKVSKLQGNGSISGCSVGEYAEAQSWNLIYQFPKLKTSSAPTQLSPSGPWSEMTEDQAIAALRGLPPWRRWAILAQIPRDKKQNILAKLTAAPSENTSKPVQKHIEDTEGEDVLTGTSWDGNLETESGHTFHITREGEIETTWRWLASQHIHYECKAGTCLVRNLSNDEAVHAGLVR